MFNEQKIKSLPECNQAYFFPHNSKYRFFISDTWLLFCMLFKISSFMKNLFLFIATRSGPAISGRRYRFFISIGQC